MNIFNDATSYREMAVFECGKEECIKSKAIALTKKTYHLFHYVTSGKGSFILNGVRYELGKNTIFFIPRDTDAIYCADKEEPWTYEWIGFDGERVDQYLEFLNISLENPIIFDSNRDYKGLFDRVVSRYLNDGYIDISSIGNLFILFGEMIHAKREKGESTSAKVTIQLAKDFIHNNYQFDINITDVAKNANVTPNYLSTIFQKEEHMSTKKYLIKLRMEKAMSFLLCGHFKIKEVAKMVGYSNQLHFSSQFKKYYGKSPLFYLEEKKK